MSESPNVHFHSIIVGDTLSVLSILGAFAGMLPPLATLAAIIWYGMMMADWFRARRERRAASLTITTVENLND